MAKERVVKETILDSQNPVSVDTGVVEKNAKTHSGKVKAGKPLADVSNTRTKFAWLGLFLGAVILITILIFILQNLQETELTFFGLHTQLPLGIVALFFAAGGAILAGIVGFLRIWQLRRSAKRTQKY